MNNLPIFMQDSKTAEILKDVKASIPKTAKAYMIGGASRNSFYYKIFKEELPQRDYDIWYSGNREQFIKNLRAHGFVYGKMKRKTHITLKKKKVSKPDKDNFSDYVILDINFATDRHVLDNLKKHANFTINGFAISIKDIDSKNWYKNAIKLTGSLKDLKNKQLRVNSIEHPANLFACIRFMSKGFKAPPKEKIKELLIGLSKFEKWRYPRNVQKLFDYVGGEKEAKRLARKLGIKHNIFVYEKLKKL